MSSISDIILKRTDTTHDLSQKAEKRYSQILPRITQAASDMTRSTRDARTSQEGARAQGQLTAHGNTRKQKFKHQLWLETKQTLSQNLTLNFTDWERMQYVCFMRILSLCWHCTVLPGEYGARAFCLRVKTMDLANAQNAITITIGGSSLRIILYMKRHDCIIENTHYIYNTHTAEGSRFQTWISKAKREGGAVKRKAGNEGKVE